MPTSLSDAVKLRSRKNRRIVWHGSVRGDELHRMYSQCDFTVYPSVVEGFGLPILESLWCGRPCVCANFGAMAETAGGGRLFTIDLRDSEKLARGHRRSCYAAPGPGPAGQGNRATTIENLAGIRPPALRRALRRL